MVKSNFISEKHGKEDYWLHNSLNKVTAGKPSAYLLPAYDEFLIGYKDRTASLMPEHHKRTITKNGIFRPVIVMNGNVTGTWKRTIKKEKLLIEASFFRPYNETTVMKIEKAAQIFGMFLEKQPEIFIK
jgi:hypothetical protein